MKLFAPSTKVSNLLPDWLVTIALAILYCTVTQYLAPFSRHFNAPNNSISHPFAHVEQVDDYHLYAYAIGFPSIVIFFALSFCVKLSNARDRWHLINISLLGLWFALALTSVVTDFLKVLIARPRPDFMERCGLATTLPGLYSLDSCKMPLGHSYLLDGLKSCPSGHLSLSFAGLGFLALWLCGQFGAIRSQKHWQIPMWKPLVCIGAPVTFASYIALSRVQDYRHHPLDVTIGSLIGAMVALMIYRRYFPSPKDQASATPYVSP